MNTIYNSSFNFWGTPSLVRGAWSTPANKTTCVQQGLQLCNIVVTEVVVVVVVVVVVGVAIPVELVGIVLVL